MNKLFEAVSTSYDPKNRPVHLCKDESGRFYIYKPATGFKSKSFEDVNSGDLKKIHDRQCACSHNAAFYEEGEREVETSAGQQSNTNSDANDGVDPATN